MCAHASEYINVHHLFTAHSLANYYDKDSTVSRMWPTYIYLYILQVRKVKQFNLLIKVGLGVLHSKHADFCNLNRS